MLVVEVLGVVVLLAAAGIGWRHHRYPGGWEFAFSAHHRGPRQDLDAARRTVRSLQSRARRELAAAHHRVDRTERAHRRRVEELAERADRLREEPGRGRLLGGLGPVALHEHVLVFLGNDVALAGLRVRFERGRTDTFLRITLPGGHEESARYPVAERAEDEVRRFGVRIRKAIAAEVRFQGEQAALIAKTEAALAAAREDTGPQEAARREVAAVTARQKDDHAIRRALREMEAARDRWEDLTGLRPPR